MRSGRRLPSELRAGREFELLRAAAAEVDGLPQLAVHRKEALIRSLERLDEVRLGVIATNGACRTLGALARLRDEKKGLIDLGEVLSAHEGDAIDGRGRHAEPWQCPGGSAPDS